jgi:hypothetical protein
MSGERVLAGCQDVSAPLVVQRWRNLAGRDWLSRTKARDERQAHQGRMPLALAVTGPREATSARMARLLDRHGYKHVHPLSGGLEAWRDAGFVIDPVHAEGALTVTP